MIQLIGIKKNTKLEIREKLSLNTKKQEKYIEELLSSVEEIVIINTCNRTEIYINSRFEENQLIDKIFDVFNWDVNLKKNCFYLSGYNVVKHLMELTSGFHSKILGEDQILGQVKNAYKQSLELKAVNSKLHRLFQDAISCGKKFRTEGKLYEIPVSSASIAVSEALKNNAKKIMLIGYGDVGKLVAKYMLAHSIDLFIIAVRDKSKVDDIESDIVRIMKYDEAREVINDMDCVISCTAAPHLMIEKHHVDEQGNPLIIFDLAVPRDIEKEIGDYNRISLYDIDNISLIDDENKKLRADRMKSFSYIIKEHIDEFIEWEKIREIAPHIKSLKIAENEVVEQRYETFCHKSKTGEDRKLVHTLLKSTSDVYVNRAIEVLKEEKLKGREKECLMILERIFNLEK